MSYKTESQKRHEMIVDFLLQFDRYSKSLKKRTEQVNTSEIHNLDVNTINSAVSILIDTLNLYGGSVGNFDLYELLQVYFKKPEIREKINNIVKEARINK